MRVSCRKAVLLISGVLWPFCFLVVVMKGRTLASAVAMSDVSLFRVVSAKPMGMHTRLTLPQYRRSVFTRGLYFSGFSWRLLWQPRYFQKPISKNMREQSFRLKDSMSGSGSAGTPRA